jgi:hypothetical protein
MMRNELFEILSRLFLRKQKHNHLLRPVRRLEQVVALDLSQMRLMREILIHAVRVEVPDRRLLHDVQPERAQKAEVDSCIRLFHEPCLLPPRAHPCLDCERSQYSLHGEFARKCQDNSIECYEGKVACSFAILDSGVSLLMWKWVREEQRRVQRVLF